MPDELRHRLRTPLNHIVGYSELLIDEAEERGLDGFVRDLRKIRGAAVELLALTDELTGGAPRHAGPIRDEELTVEPAAGAPGVELLVVDDNADNLEVVCRFLARAGYRTTQASGGAAALERVKEAPPDLILLDVMMPEIDGIEVCRRLKADPETRLVPIVIMTALGDVEDRVRGIAAGADDFLTKPVNRTELLARIETSLRLKQTVEQKLSRLQGARDALARFVPESVRRAVADGGDAPARTDRDLTALFVDVTAYARLSESLRQTADFLVERYFSAFLDAIHAQGGEVTETSGDGLMVVFAAGEPREHAAAAVRAALAILRTTEALNAQLRGIFEPLAVHVGINSGIALIGPVKYEGANDSRWTYTALGPVVNLAARIAAVAESGMICVGPETARRVEAGFTLEDLGRRRLKNVKDEVPIRRVVG